MESVTVDTNEPETIGLGVRNRRATVGHGGEGASLDQAGPGRTVVRVDD